MKKYSEILKNSSLFKGLTEDGINALIKSAGARVKVVKKDEYALSSGDVTEEMGIVLSGAMLIIQEDIWGHCNIIGHAFAGDIFAEVFAAAAGAALNVSVVASEDSDILFIDVNRLLSAHDGGADGAVVARNLISAMAKKMLALNEKVTHISKRTTKEKLLSYLSSQAVFYGSLSFSIPFNRQQLADYLCVERAAMSVELSKLQREGILTYNKNRFVLKRIINV